MGTLRVQHPGLLTSIQDLGRPGSSDVGVPIGGAADALSLRIGNRLVGNADSAAAIEMTLVGATLVFDEPAVACIIGGECRPTLEGRPVASHAAMAIPSGATLALGPITRGVRVYLCIAGGVDAPVVLGSRSTHLSAGFGGHLGRALTAGDRLSFMGHTVPPPPRRTMPSQVAHAGFDSPSLRVVPSIFASDDPFWSARHTVSNQSNRAGVRLHRSAALASNHSAAGRMTTEGMPAGAIQLPPGGEPIILGPDHPTTGGYPVIGCVASVDLHLVGQLRPGEAVGFLPITQTQALALYREQERSLDSLLPPIPSP